MAIFIRHICGEGKNSVGHRCSNEWLNRAQVQKLQQVNNDIQSKAMHLPKIFGLSTFPVFRVFRYFEVRNKSGIRAPVWKVIENFAKLTKNFPENP